MASLWRISKAWRAARRDDRHRPRFDLRRSELEFLPAALEITETPARPLGRVLVYVLAVAFSAAVAWAYFGRIDTVAVAQGRIMPDDKVKTIQALETALVTEIHVRDGQFVRAGDVLIELDPTESAADVERLVVDLMNARLDAVRFESLLRGEKEHLTASLLPTGAPDPLILAAERLLATQAAELTANLAVVDREVSEAESEGEIVDEQIARLEAIIPLVRERVAAWKTLAEQGYGSRLTYLENEQLLREHEGEFAMQHRRRQQVQATLGKLAQRMREIEAQAMTEYRQGAEEAGRKVAALEQELIKARQRLATRKLTAPVDGTVQQLQVSTIGGVVQTGAPLLIIVPDDATLRIEAFVLNRDIGFVELGQEVEIKVESFPFTRYGFIHGVVSDLSRDAVKDEQQGLVYVAQVAMARDQILVGDQWVQLTPGMNVTVEVRTGQRQVLDYFLAPFVEYQNDALRER